MFFRESVGRFFINILYFTVLFMLLMSLCRLAFILEAGFIGGSIGLMWSIDDIMTTLFNGARYDGRIVSFLSLIYGLLYILTSSSKKRPLILTAFSLFLSFVTIFLWVCNTVYFNIYGDTFNTVILGLIYDDRQAIFQTGVSGDYNILLRIFLTILSTWLFSYIFYVGLKKISQFKFKKVASALISSVIVCYVTALLMASTLNLKGGSLDYLITPAKNPFLMKAAPGALRDIYVVYLNYKDIINGDFDRFSAGLSPREVAKIYFQKDIETQELDLSLLMKRKVETGSSRIKHIFVIIGESLSEWHFDKEFKEVGITEGLSEIASSDKGKKMPVFIQSGNGTIGTLDVMLTGLYSADFPISSMVGVLESFLSSNAVFKTLGYSNYFYYFGSPSWRKLDRYVLSQGFDKLYSVSDMGTQKRGVWGVYDNDGFDFVLGKALEHADEFTFNMILTTSYHPPYDVPVKDYGVPVDEIKSFLDKKYPENIRSKEMNPNIMAHLWLMDKSVSKFV
ncbi:MAG: hypothetical protein IJD28_05335, partial [Deferribacterales bacterium]|nr:hypothetical protein [Deferribacterales bacterium]